MQMPHNLERLTCDKTKSAFQEMDTDPEAWNLRKVFVLEPNGLVDQILYLKANLI